jgi:hypothetical protein
MGCDGACHADNVACVCWSLLGAAALWRFTACFSPRAGQSSGRSGGQSFWKRGWRTGSDCRRRFAGADSRRRVFLDPAPAKQTVGQTRRLKRLARSFTGKGAVQRQRSLPPSQAHSRMPISACVILHEIPALAGEPRSSPPCVNSA